MTIEIGILISVIGVLIAILSFALNRDKVVKNDASKSAVIETKLDSIGQAVDSIRIDLRASEQRWNALSENVVRIDESTKQAHKRIDKLENKGEVQ